MDHLLAPLVLEIDVDVGRLFPLGRDEALEQEVDLGRVDIGDGEAIADGGVGGGAAPLAENAEAARVVHDVMDGEEVGRVVERGDEHEFLLDGVADMSGNAVRETPLSALPSEILEMGLRGLAVWHRLVRIFIFQLIEGEGAGLRDLDGAVKRFLVASEQARHLFRGFQMPLGIGFETEAGFRYRALLADAGEHVLERAAVGCVIEHAARGDEGRSNAHRKLCECRDAGAIAAAIGMPRGEIEGLRQNVFDA